jgi:hypothetical protein
MRRNGDKQVGIVTHYGLDDWNSILGRGKTFFLLHSVQTGTGTHPDSYTMGYRFFSPEVKR